MDRLNVAEDERNRAVWEPAIAAGGKAKVCWEIDNARWKQALYQLSLALIHSLGHTSNGVEIRPGRRGP